MIKQSSMLHIMVLLKYLGSYGNEASLQKIGRMMAISKGAVNEFVGHASSAILKLGDQVIKWPNEAETLVHKFEGCMVLSIALARSMVHCFF